MKGKSSDDPTTHLFIAFLVLVNSCICDSLQDTLLCPGGTLAYALSFGVPTKANWNGVSRDGSDQLAQLSANSSFSICVMCSEIRMPTSSLARSFSLDPQRRTYQMCLNNGYSVDRTFNQLFKCGNTEDFMHTFTKNISDETSTFRCRRADQPWNGGVGQQEFVDVEYESHFPEKKTSSSNGNNKIIEGSLSVVRAKSNWHNMETIDLNCGGDDAEEEGGRNRTKQSTPKNQFICGLKITQGRDGTFGGQGESTVTNGRVDPICCDSEEVVGKPRNDFVHSECTAEKKVAHLHAVVALGVVAGLLLVVVIVLLVKEFSSCCGSTSPKTDRVSPRYTVKDNIIRSSEEFNSRPNTTLPRKQSVVHRNGVNSGFRIVPPPADKQASNSSSSANNRKSPSMPGSANSTATLVHVNNVIQPS